MELNQLIKKITREIQRLEQQRTIKLSKRNQLDEELNLINLHLKDLNNLKSKKKKFEKNTDSFFDWLNNGGQ